jgi:ABC-type multidrug transport system ATPase subunit
MIHSEHIYKSYGVINALSDISFDVSEGEIFGFIGPDGAGKSSLFRILTTLILPDKGHATIDGLDVVNDFRKVRLITGYMPGQFSLYTDLTVEENLSFFATVFGTSLKKNYHLIREVYKHIEPFKNRLAGRLSGGMKQKLALSCALIHEPRVLVLDEPTTGVDAVSRREFWELLKGLKQKGITILVSTPYMDEADMCDRIALVQKGKIMVVDTPQTITGRFDKILLAIRSSNMNRLIADLRDYPQTNSAFTFGQYIHFTSMKEAPQKDNLIDYLSNKGHSQLEILETSPSIEDCFMELMNKNK